jgi:2-(1,2-epoxy-1,2-dihydrophenyl)acetyl-CoA isomerase
MTADPKPVLLTIDGAVAEIRLNRPSVLNVLDPAMAEALSDAVSRVADDPAIRAVVLAGEGRSFMAGGDLTCFSRDFAAAPAMAEQLIASFHRSVMALGEMAKPVIAALKGPVAGGGFSLALASDIAIAAEDLRLTVAYTAIGTTPDGGLTHSLPRQIGARHALALALLNEPIDAAEALRLGLVHRVVARERLEAETRALAQRLAAGPTLAYARLKRLIRGSATATVPGQLDAERRQFVASAATEDFRTGIAAFFARRPPDFTAS